MIAPYDIFILKRGEYVWLEVAKTLDDAKVRVQKLGATQPGDYLIFNQNTVQSISLTVYPPKPEAH